MNFIEELSWRGLLHQATEGVEAALQRPLLAYVGFDPTGPSLHVGHLVQVMGLTHLQRSTGGHRPVVLVGGGTGMIGDPSGRSAERNLLTLDEVAANADGIRGQLARFLDFDGPRGAVMRNNVEWLAPLRMVDFLRDVGKHFTVNYMTAKESVRARLEDGISFTEFAYMLLQAYDFLELYRRDGVTMQMGGSDQWGNITAGTELIRRSTGGSAFGLTLPLITAADGAKFGKTTEGTSVWLDAARTSPYRFYQYWINADDSLAGSLLRKFTLLEREAIEALEQELTVHPDKRSAQGALAFDVTARVHGRDAAEAARAASRVVFDRKADPRALPLTTLVMLRGEIPSAVVPAEGASVSVVDALVRSGLLASRGEARRQLQQGSVSANGRRLGGDELSVALTEALHSRFFLMRKGGRDVALIEVEV
ncbi:MAG: tyrosine--tRNA ligase [Gemmatimonadota bacterium]